MLLLIVLLLSERMISVAPKVWHRGAQALQTQVKEEKDTLFLVSHLYRKKQHLHR